MIRRILPGDAYYAPVTGGVVRTVAESSGYAVKLGDAEVFVSDGALADAAGARAREDEEAETARRLAEATVSTTREERLALGRALADGFVAALDSGSDDSVEDNGR